MPCGQATWVEGLLDAQWQGCPTCPSAETLHAALAYSVLISNRAQLLASSPGLDHLAYGLVAKSINDPPGRDRRLGPNAGPLILS